MMPEKVSQLQTLLSEAIATTAALKNYQEIIRICSEQGYAATSIEELALRVEVLLGLYLENVGPQISELAADLQLIYDTVREAGS